MPPVDIVIDFGVDPGAENFITKASPGASQRTQNAAFLMPPKELCVSRGIYLLGNYTNIV